MRAKVLLALAVLVLPVSVAAQSTASGTSTIYQGPCATTYTAGGSAVVNVSFSFGGSCGAGSVVNNIPWTGTTFGSAVCPTTFQNGDWNWAFYMTASAQSGNDAGCFFGLGPGFTWTGTDNGCAMAGEVCQEAYVVGLGTFMGAAFLPGQFYFFGQTSCSPDVASNTVTTSSGTCACP